MADHEKAELDAIKSAEERAQTLRLLLTLVERATSQSVVKDFLKQKKLPYSAGSWDEMREKRLIPAFDEGKLLLSDLHQLLRRTEGFGRQHIFLFHARRERVETLLSERRILAVLAEAGNPAPNSAPIVVDQPGAPTIVDVQYGHVGEKQYLSVKEIEKRVSKKLLSEKTEGDVYTKVYRMESQRAINFARLWSDGLLEIRIASRDNATKYHDELRNFFNRISHIFRFDEFVEISLVNLKARLWRERFALKDTLRFSTYELRDDTGATLRANAALSTDDLAEHTGVAKSLEQFQGKQVFCSDSNVYFKTPSSTTSEREVHVLLNGEDNEFAITALITEEEYEYVLHKILQYH